MDALSSAVAMKVNCELQLTLMASSLCCLPGVQIANGYTIRELQVCLELRGCILAQGHHFVQ
jgi:hypothetical protein